MTSKLRIKIGEIEIDFEGTEDFIKQELPELLKTAADLHKIAGASAAKEKKAPPGEAGKVASMTTATIAKKRNAQSGTDLIIAAAANLTLVKGNATFTRQQLLEEMKTATGFYKKTFSNNLSTYLKSLLGADLTESATDTFSLSEAKRASLEKELANS